MEHVNLPITLLAYKTVPPLTPILLFAFAVVLFYVGRVRRPKSSRKNKVLELPAAIRPLIDAFSMLIAI
ncbi:MAG TPA: hypothetical protein VHM26_15340 [Chitinophagaceae bacterium]|jgi:hypothetical protein|nr:hypothetical protein [Chitinophagaceae bacterium]